MRSKLTKKLAASLAIAGVVLLASATDGPVAVAHETRQATIAITSPVQNGLEGQVVSGVVEVVATYHCDRGLSAREAWLTVINSANNQSWRIYKNAFHEESRGHGTVDFTWDTARTGYVGVQAIQASVLCGGCATTPQRGFFVVPAPPA